MTGISIDAQRRGFLDLIPDGWIKQYLYAMVAADNEMPLPFHFLSACVVIGQLIGLDAWATLAKGVRIYPNINGLLLSPAGKCRRGEGTKIITNIAKRAGVNVLSGKTSPEGLLDELEERGDVLLYVEELAILLTKQDFQRPIIAILTKLLLHGDGPLDMRTRGMGERRVVEHVNLSALFTSAPDWFMTTIPEEAYGGGMMSRFIVCCLEDRDVYSIDIQAADYNDYDVLDSLATGLAKTKNVLTGHIQGTNDAQEWIREWYIQNETAPLEDERHAPHRNRKPANLLRLAMILGAAADDATLTAARLQQSLNIINWMEPTLTRLYGLTKEIVNTMEKGEKRILTKLAYENGGTAKHALLARHCASYFRGGTKEMRRCLEGMVEKGFIEAAYRNGVPMWPPLTWKLKRQLNELASKETNA